MKRIYLLLALLLSVSLSACGTEYTQTISYEDKILILESQAHEYEEVSVKDIPDVYLGSSLKQVYLEAYNIITQNTGENLDNTIENIAEKDDDYFRDSLFFAQEEIDSDIELSQFVNDNITKVFTYYEIEKEEDRVQTSFVCKSKLISAELLEFSSLIDEENSLYFAQYFYIHAGVANVISFVSDDKNERKLFVSSMDSFSCN